MSGGQPCGPGSAESKGRWKLCSKSVAVCGFHLAAVSRSWLFIWPAPCFAEQDLREECIKLKMLVFDLERQNRALCELFQQKLPNHPTAHYQVLHTNFLCDSLWGLCVSLRLSSVCLRRNLINIWVDCAASVNVGPLVLCLNFLTWYYSVIWIILRIKI